MSATPPKPTPRRVGDFIRLGDVIDELLDEFERAVEEEIEKHGGFHGHVRTSQRRLSQTLDELTHGRDIDSLKDQE